MRADGPATAEGDLERTPFAHLLVYAVERQLTGAMFLLEPSGAEHVVRFVRGTPVKVRPSDGFARFGELLLEEGLITVETLADALATTGLLGDVLLLSGCIDSVTLDWIAELQFVRRMAHLFELPSETTYRYFDGHDALADWGGDPASVDPMAILWAGLREHGERSTRLQSTLDLLGPTPLHLHVTFTPGRFGLRAAELGLISALQARSPSLPELLESKVIPEPTLRKLVYALVITRYIDLGTGSVPVGVEEPAVSSSLLPTPSQALARVQLRATVHRVGAAAPDPPGDGERAPMQIRSRRRDSQAAQLPLAASASGPVSIGAGGSAGGSLVGAVAAELAYAAPQPSTSDASGEPLPMDADRESGFPASVDSTPPASNRRVRSGPPERSEAEVAAPDAANVSGVVTLPPGDLVSDLAPVRPPEAPRGEVGDMQDEPTLRGEPGTPGDPTAEPPPASAEGPVALDPGAGNR